MQIGRFHTSRAVLLSIVLHITIVLLLTFGIEFHSSPVGRRHAEEPRIVRAVAVDQQLVEKEIKRLQAGDDRRKLEAERALKNAEDQRRTEEQKLKDLKAEQERINTTKAAEQKQLEAEKQRIAAEKAQIEAEKHQKAEAQKKIEVEKQRIAAEKTRLEAEKRQKAEEQKKTEEARKKAEAEKERVAAEKKKTEDAQSRKAEEQKRVEDARQKAVAEKQRLEEERRAQALHDEMAAEEDDAEIDRYIAAIQSRVANAFVFPDFEEGLRCKLYVRMIPGGEVADVKVIESSGNSTFDRQAENAVRRAAPLPTPSDPRLFGRMQEIKFVFDPEQ